MIINVDSIGQPRNITKLSTLLVLDIKANQFNLEFIKVPYDLSKHKKSIRNALFSEETQKKLFSFF